MLYGKERYTMKEYIAIVHEKGDYDYPTTYTFDSLELLRTFLIGHKNVLWCKEWYSVSR